MFMFHVQIAFPQFIKLKIDHINSCTHSSLTGDCAWFSFFDCSAPFCFLLIEFNCTFSTYCKILTNYVYYYCVVVAVRTSFFFCARFTSFYTHASLLTFFVCIFVLFHSCCSHARVFGKTLLHEFPISCISPYWMIPKNIYLL